MLSQYLDLDLDVPLAVPAEGIGEGRVDGSTRKLVIEQRETLRGSALTKALKNHPNQGLRPVRIWPQMDKLSTSWLLALPGPNNGLTSPIFSEAVCSNLGLPSPVCRDKIGERIGRSYVDLYGDKVMAAQLPGDTWRIRHDTVKSEINRLMMWCSMRSTCEVFGLFSHLIPQEGLNRMERGRARQGMVPDFLIELPNQAGAKASRLAELKVINCCPTRYAPGQNGKAVDRRARLLHGEYKRKARDADQVYGNHSNEGAGPVERKLSQYGELVGLVVGAFGEGSEDLHNLVQKLAESKVGAMGLRSGREATDEEVGIVVGQLRRSLSTTFVRAQAQCLISRLQCIGKGYAEAAKRRKWAAFEDDKMRQERQAQWIGKDRGRDLVSRGQFLLFK